MFYGLTFLGLGLMWFYQALTAPFLWLSLLLCNAGVCFSLLGFGFLLSRSCRNGSKWAAVIFGKRNDGRRSLWAYVIHWPFLLVNNLIFWLHWFSKENWCDEILPNIILGRFPTLADKGRWQKLSIVAVVDMTAEFAACSYVRELAYYALPTFDETPPSKEALIEVANWIEEQQQKGPVFIHCARGHGRSATALAAWLLLKGKCSSLDEAEELMKKGRPKVRMSRWQKEMLEQLS